MSKSLGNLVFVRDLLKDWEGAAVRLALLGHHYREDWDWQNSDMAEAAARLECWRSAAAGSGAIGLAGVRERLDDDLDAPGALSVLDEEASAGRSVEAGASLLGVDL